MSDNTDILNFFEANDFDDECMLFDLTIPDDTKIDLPHNFEETLMDESVDVDLLLDAGNPIKTETDVLQPDADKTLTGEEKNAARASPQDITDNFSFKIDDISVTGQETNAMGALQDRSNAFPVAHLTPLEIHQMFTENEIIEAAMAIMRKYPALSAPDSMYGQIQNSHPLQWKTPFQNADSFQTQPSVQTMPNLPAHSPGTVSPYQYADVDFSESLYPGDQRHAATKTGASAQETDEQPNRATRVVDHPATKNAEEDSDNSNSPLSHFSSEFAGPIFHTKEKPKNDPSRPHIRINKTSGASIRSSKMNNFNPKKQYSKHKGNVFTNWVTSTGKRIEYNQIGELSEPALSIGQMKRFIYEHAALPDKRMILWIQRCPADSARRYHSTASSKCRFLDCPDPKRTIMPGHVRVVFDEKWTTHGDKQDPFIFAGTAHLYCMERFLNFPDICKLQNVEVRAETRPMPKEMESKNRAALSGDEAKTALRFINACRRGRLSEKFPGYPSHRPGGYQKDYSRTLSFAMQVEINKTRAIRGQINFNRHNGDLELYTKSREANVHSIKDRKRKVLSDTLDEVYDEGRSSRESTALKPSGDAKALEQRKKRKLSNHIEEAQDNDLDRPRPQSKGASIVRSPETEYHNVTVQSPRKRQHSEVERDSEEERCKRLKIS